MNPFHDGMVSAFGLHAVMAREVARAGQRVVQGKPWRFFYNPMWACFGDRPPGPPGTFFLSSSKPINHFWHILDQVLVRPSLMDKLNNVRIVASLDNDGEPSLLDHLGHPLGTDHLPIFFQLDL